MVTYEIKRNNHFLNFINDFNVSRQLDNVNQVDYDHIVNHINTFIIDVNSLNNIKMKKILKNLNLRKYYENDSNIPIETINIPIETINIPIETINIPIETINIPIETINIPIETINIFSDNDINEILNVFNFVAHNFRECAYPRICFFNYNYLLYKICELLNLNSQYYIRQFVPYQNNSQKWIINDEIWNKICDRRNIYLSTHS